MSALQFLNKKSWHPSKKDNSEKLWLREQEAARERARIAELQKQLEEERKLEQIHKLEIASGRLDPAQVLKRKRLNWMYEYGPNQIPAAAKAKDHKLKEQDDLLLGKKEVDLDELANERNQQQASATNLFVDAEAKLREDPLLEIKRQHALMTAAPRKRPSSSQPVDDPKGAKRRRKEQRRQIREQRKRRREQRSQKDAPRSAEAACDVHGSEGQQASKRRRELDDATVQAPSRRHWDAQQYGLHVPAGGTRVAVTSQFVPRSRSERDLERQTRMSHGRPPLPPSHRNSPENRQQRVDEMRKDAESLEEERLRRIAKYLQMEQRERAREAKLRAGEASGGANGRQQPAHSFAREAMNKAASTAERVRRRRAWSTKDDMAAY